MEVYALSEHFEVFIRLLFSAAVAYPLWALTVCVFRDALLRTTVVMCHLVSFDQSGPPLNSHKQSIFARRTVGYWMFFIFHTIHCKLKIPGDQQFLRYSNHPVWHQQSNNQSNLGYISSPFWYLVWQWSLSVVDNPLELDSWKCYCSFCG